MTTADTILEGLDESQRLAATTVQGPVRIIAGAGAGKTRTVTRRIAYACETGQWDPSGVLAVTFSVKAATEMRARLRQLGVGESVTAATFHSAALRQLRDVWEDICDAPFPRVAEEDELERIVSVAMRQACPDAMVDPNAVRDVHAEINWAKVSLIAPGDYSRVCAALHRRPPAGIEPQRFEDVYDCYEREKTAHGLIDFDDILLIACHVLCEFDDVAETIRRSVRWLTVDEYQDVSPLQHRLMMLWLGAEDKGPRTGMTAPANRNACVVGDPAQTIYSFAGASSYDLLSFDEQFGKPAADVHLRTDYRSTAQIVGYANRVLARSPNRADYLRLVSGRGDGAKVTHTIYETDEHEAQGVAGRIARMVAHGADPADCAILTRINAQQQIVRAALKDVGLHCRVRRDAGWSGASDMDPVGRQTLLESLGADGSKLEGAVTISTIHASKGLEFKHVFVVGCSEGLLPFGSATDGEQIEEERRLAYVAVTRAEDSLHLSYARTKDGLEPGRSRVPSRFL